jgi:hypothetical protein
MTEYKRADNLINIYANPTRKNKEIFGVETVALYKNKVYT